MIQWITLLLLTVLMVACNNHKGTVLNPAQQKARFDSVVKLKIKEAMENEAQLQRDRMAIEMKEKIDSIEQKLSAQRAAQPILNTDTTTHSLESATTDSSTSTSTPKL